METEGMGDTYHPLASSPHIRHHLNPSGSVAGKGGRLMFPAFQPRQSRERLTRFQISLCLWHVVGKLWEIEEKAGERDGGVICLNVYCHEGSGVMILANN